MKAATRTPIPTSGASTGGVTRLILGSLHHDYQLVDKATERNEWTGNAKVHNMDTKRAVIPGIVKNGLVVPQNDTPLPDGTHVEIIIGPADVTPALQAEFDQWEQASDEAWAMIDRWET
jgi:hypothetical protein